MDVDRIRLLLVKIYGEHLNSHFLSRLFATLDKYRALIPAPHRPNLSEKDVFLITYPDQVQEAGRPSLQVLGEFCETHLSGLISGIHILPFFPWSSDDGFSVIDYCSVAPEYGTWRDISALGRNFGLMFDAVINHVSVQSEWFQGFLGSNPKYSDYFITVDGTPDLSHVVRPRALPLLTPFETASGEKNVWTTFSADQVDLNYSNPEVLLEIVDVLLFYISKGAEFIRLDAIAYLWKEIKASCIHLPNTHLIIQLLRAVLDEVAPHVTLITETNVPHIDNISYFGDGTNEAQMVYNFSLPPLVLHAFQTGSAETLTHWAGTLELSSDKVAFFNFLASHDGIGLNPLRGILAEAEVEKVVETVLAHGGLVSNKTAPDGTHKPYELNVNYFDALTNSKSDEMRAEQVQRFLTAHSILLAFRGVPAIYFHSLVGSRGWPEGAKQTGQNRTINRKKFHQRDLEYELFNIDSEERRVFDGFKHLLGVRRTHVAFHPHGMQYVVDCCPGVFAVLRVSPDGAEHVFCLHNVTDQIQKPGDEFLEAASTFSLPLRDLVTGQSFDSQRSVILQPYQTLWLA